MMDKLKCNQILELSGLFLILLSIFINVFLYNDFSPAQTSHYQEKISQRVDELYKRQGLLEDGLNIVLKGQQEGLNLLSNGDCKGINCDNETPPKTHFDLDNNRLTEYTKFFGYLSGGLFVLGSALTLFGKYKEFSLSDN